MLVNAALMLFYSFGAVVGPLGAAYFMQAHGATSLFLFSAGVYAIFIAITLYRMGRQAGRAGRPAGAFHGAAQDIDDVCQTGPAQRKRRGSEPNAEGQDSPHGARHRLNQLRAWLRPINGQAARQPFIGYWLSTSSVSRT